MTIINTTDYKSLKTYSKSSIMYSASFTHTLQIRLIFVWMTDWIECV